MKSAVLINAIWIAIAAATFAIGRMTANTDGPSDASADAVGSGSNSRLSAIDDDPAAGSSAAELDAADAEVDGRAFLAKYLQGEARFLSAENMSAAMREAMGETDPIKRSLMIAQLMQNLTAENAKEALAILRETPDRRENWQYFSLLNYAWGKIDGAGAIEAAMETGGRGRGFAAMSVLSGWATSDPEAAKTWIDGQEDGREKMMYMGGLIDGMSKSDPAAATELVLEMAAPEGDTGWWGDPRSRYLDNIAGEMLKQGVDPAAEWAQKLPEGNLREGALGEIAEFQARNDPAAAAKWVESIIDGGDANEAVRQVADEWVNKSPKDAADWVATMPAETQPEAMREVFSEWAEDEPVAASEYLATMEPSAGRDSAVSGFSRELAGDDPSRAIEWASSIADEELRLSTEVSVARRWYRDEPEAAQAWAQQNLPEESAAAVSQGDGRGGDRRGPGGRGR